MGVKQVLIKQGQAIVEEVPAPQVEPGTLLVEVDHSCISIGTEMSGIRATGMPLWERALKQPENVKKVLQMIATQGIAKTTSLVQERLVAGLPTGYSAAGIVIEVGEGVNDIKPGDRVACAGAQCAHHAQIIRVPRNLCASIPENLAFSEASTVTLGAIALQGVRRAGPTLGETFVVIGLGILGQMTAQLLAANGCRVIGIDLDSSRIDLAKSLGMAIGINPGSGDDIEQVWRLTGGIGADGVIITAATASDQVMSTSFKMCRKKGRVVLVGDVGLDLNRNDFYLKELDFFISSSYGPGRYDGNYEEKGLDYPVGYVRWTENRNMLEYLNCLAEGKVRISHLISAIRPVSEAAAAYESLKSEDVKPLMVLLEYPKDRSPDKVVPNPSAVAAAQGKIRIAVVGAGGFAKAIHLPNLQALKDSYHVQAIVSRTGHNAMSTAKQFGANYASTDFGAVLEDKNIDAIVIATRHDLHANMALEALKAGKHVLVEKPLALTVAELDAIEAFYKEAESPPILLTGFNRRFSRYAKKIRELTEARSNPMILNYRMNAGYIPLDNWVHGKEGGGRNRGEACHIYDLFTYLTGSKVMTVQAATIRPTTGYYSPSDNFVATMTFEDGSVATLTYTALGAKGYPKEKMELYCDGKVIILDDYRSLSIAGSKASGIETKAIDKGQIEELEAFAGVIRKGSIWPIPLWQQIQATEIALRIEKALTSSEHNDRKNLETQ